MSTVDQYGFGSIEKNDYVKLMEKHGFRVDSAEDILLKYAVSWKFSKNLIQTKVLTGFPELYGEDRRKFCSEYMDRIEQQNTLDPDELDTESSLLDGFQIFGEKVREISPSGWAL